MDAQQLETEAATITRDLLTLRVEHWNRFGAVHCCILLESEAYSFPPTGPPGVDA
jgi:hypothetical protein